MRRLLIALAVAAMGSSAVYADEASKTAKIEEMFKLLRVDQLQTQMREQMKGAIANMFAQPGMPAEAKAAQKELEDEVFGLIAKKASWAQMKPAFVKIYSETLSEDELDGILTFYKSPSGQAILEKMPQLTKRGMEEVAQPLMKNLMPEMQELIEKFVERHKTK